MITITKHRYVIFACVVIIGITLLFLPRFKHKNTPIHNNVLATNNTSILNLEDVIKVAYPKLNGEDISTLKTLTNNYQLSELDEVKFDALIQFWTTKVNDPMLRQYLVSQKAELNNNYRALIKSNFFLTKNLLTISNSDLRQWFAKQCIENYNFIEKHIQDNSLNDSVIIGKSFCVLVSGLSPTPMKTIQNMLNIVEKNPNNLYAEYYLGVASMISSQWNKAIPRFEKIIEADPNNAEVLFYLGNAYQRSSQKEKALQIFEKLKIILSENNIDLLPDIDATIDKLKEET